MEQNSFKFAETWLKYEGFMKKVKMWTNFLLHSWILELCPRSKTQILKANLDVWNEQVFVNMGTQEKLLLGIRKIC